MNAMNMDARPSRDSRATINLPSASPYSMPSRVSSIPAKRLQDSTSKTAKPKSTQEVDISYNHASHISLSPHNNRGYFLTTTNPAKHKRNHIYHHPTQTSMHQSTLLSLTASNDDSDLWILPDFDEWEADAESPQQEVAPPRPNAEWAPLLARAVNSNRERLRRRLEGDGWDFVGGKYGEDGKLLKEVDVDVGSEESVDEEFDVVVLPMVDVSC